MKRMYPLLTGLLMLVFAVGFTGCDSLEALNPFSNEMEVTGLVETIGDASLTVDGIDYAITDATEFDGIDSLADLAVGDEVEVEYTESGSDREAVEVGLADAD